MKKNNLTIAHTTNIVIEPPLYEKLRLISISRQLTIEELVQEAVVRQYNLQFDDLDTTIAEESQQSLSFDELLDVL